MILGTYLSYSNYTNLNSLSKSSKTDSFDNYIEESNQMKKFIENTKIVNKNLINSIEKYDGFSSLSSEDKKLFKEILYDDYITFDEIKKLDYEQAKKFDELRQKSMHFNMQEEIIMFSFEDDSVSKMLSATNITYDDDFNNAFFETFKEIDNEKERHQFYWQVATGLGSKNARSVSTKDFGMITIEESNKRSGRELLNVGEGTYVLSSFEHFIYKLLKEFKDLSTNPNISLETSVIYKLIYKNLSKLEKNHQEIKRDSI